jgi:N-acetylglucosamine-6-phosphate deacetylase
MLVEPGRSVGKGDLLLQAGQIAAINPSAEAIPVDCEHIDAFGHLLTPGLVDIHTHGIHAHSYERGPEDLLNGIALAPRYGTTCVLPTLYKVLHRDGLVEISQLADALTTAPHSIAPGFHFEGPFLAIAGAGARTVPGDLVLLEELLSAAKGLVRVMSVSPECPNVIPVIERLRAHEVTVFVTHTRASVEQTQAAIDAGARHATHFYDVFPVPEETEPGVRPVGAVETLLADERCSVDFICDGVHVHPMAIRAALAAKGSRGVVAITDSNVGAGLPDGVYDTPWDYKVKVSTSDAARVHNSAHPLHGLLSGSSLTMNRAVENLHKWLALPDHEIWAMATSTPARLIGLPKKGTLAVGADADVVLWDSSEGRFEASQTWVRGVCVYQRDEQPTSPRSQHDRLVSV